MSAQLYEPLHVVPPLTETHVRMAWLLRAREAGRKALDAALAAPRKAVGYLSRLVHKLHLHSAASWLHRAVARLTQPLAKAASRLGKTGLLAAATGIVTSPTGHAVMNKIGRLLAKTVGWVARETYSGIDRALRCFGSAGNKAADTLFSGVVSLGGKVATVATPVVHRVARLSDPATTQARVLSGICQSYVVHKLLKGFIGNTWLRLLAEVVLVPTILDSRLWAWMRSVLREAHTRAQGLQEQAQVLVDLEQQPSEGDQLPLPEEFDDAYIVTTLEEPPVPSNRAERRAAQRQGKRPQH